MRYRNRESDIMVEFVCKAQKFNSGKNWIVYRYEKTKYPINKMMKEDDFKKTYEPWEEFLMKPELFKRRVLTIKKEYPFVDWKGCILQSLYSLDRVILDKVTNSPGAKEKIVPLTVKDILNFLEKKWRCKFSDDFKNKLLESDV